jgi:hypothetical protein
VAGPALVGAAAVP